MRLSLEIRNLPAAAYRQCTVSLASSGPNTGTIAAAGAFNDYQLTQAAGGVRAAGGGGANAADAVLLRHPASVTRADGAGLHDRPAQLLDLVRVELAQDLRGGGGVDQQQEEGRAFVPGVARFVLGPVGQLAGRRRVGPRRTNWRRRRRRRSGHGNSRL